MDEKIKKLTSRMKLKSSILKESAFELQNSLGAKLPNDYMKFLLEANGAEGTIGSSYLVLWGLTDLIALNTAYKVNKYAPGLILIGSNGGDMAYAIDIRDKIPKYIEVPFIGMNISEIKYCADDFVGFLEYLINRRNSL